MARDLDATSVAADGSTEVMPHEVAEDPPIDCFYVYPTISGDPGPNSDLVPAEAEEVNTVYNQAARLTSSCRMFAPVYRQLTLSMIGGGGGSRTGHRSAGDAYGDVVDAFKSYIANDSDGRGFVLIGHSQGRPPGAAAGGRDRRRAPLRDRLVSAYILGSTVHVPEGEVVGGDLDNIPLCEADDQTGCVVTHATFRASAPPDAASFFGRNDVGRGLRQPGGPGGRRPPLHPYILVDGQPAGILGGSLQPFADPARTAEIQTPGPPTRTCWTASARATASSRTWL